MFPFFSSFLLFFNFISLRMCLRVDIFLDVCTLRKTSFKFFTKVWIRWREHTCTFSTLFLHIFFIFSSLIESLLDSDLCKHTYVCLRILHLFFELCITRRDFLYEILVRLVKIWSNTYDGISFPRSRKLTPFFQTSGCQYFLLCSEETLQKMIDFIIHSVMKLSPVIFRQVVFIASIVWYFFFLILFPQCFNWSILHSSRIHSVLKARWIIGLSYLFVKSENTTHRQK